MWIVCTNNLFLYKFVLLATRRHILGVTEQKKRQPLPLIFTAFCSTPWKLRLTLATQKIV